MRETYVRQLYLRYRDMHREKHGFDPDREDVAYLFAFHFHRKWLRAQRDKNALLCEVADHILPAYYEYKRKQGSHWCGGRDCANCNLQYASVKMHEVLTGRKRAIK